MTESQISPDDSLRIKRAMHNMPYAAHTRVPMPVSGITVNTDDVVAYLEGLAGVLRDAASRHTALEQQHNQLTRDVQAFRRIIGTDPL